MELRAFLWQGYILTSEIDGTIQMKSYLTGNPEIKVGLNEDLTIGRGSSGSYGKQWQLWHHWILTRIFSFSVVADSGSCLSLSTFRILSV